MARKEYGFTGSLHLPDATNLCSSSNYDNLCYWILVFFCVLLDPGLYL